MRHLIVLIAVSTFFFSCKDDDSAAKKEVKAYSIQQFYKTETITGGNFNKDESKVAVNSNRNGIFNVYEIDLADTSIKPITNSTKESFFVSDYVAGTDNIIYTADRAAMKIHTFTF